MLTTLLVVVAIVLFILAALPVVPQKFGFMAAGLACWALSTIIGPYLR